MLKRFFKIVFKVVLWGVGALLMLLVLLVFIIRMPSVQNYISHKATSFISSKTHTRVELKRLYIGFPKTVVIEQLYAEDASHDTLLSVQKLEVDVDMLALLHKKVNVNDLVLSGTTANIERNTDSVYNFEFLIKAFSSGTKKPVVVNKPVKADTTGWQIQVNKISIKNVRGNFTDAVGGTSIEGFIGDLELKMKTINLKHLSFNGNELSLSNSNVRLVQKKEGAETPDTSITLMPLLSLKKLQLQNVGFIYEDQVRGQSYSIQADKVFLLPRKIDLNARIIQADTVDIEGTSAAISMRKNSSDTTVSHASATSSPTNTGWQIGADAVKLVSVNFSYDITNSPREKDGIDYNHLALTNTNIDIAKATYNNNNISANIRNISFKEKSGFELKKLSAQAVYDDRHAQLKNLILLTNHSVIGNYLSIAYPSISSIGKDIGALAVNGNFDNTCISVDDILFFAPQLREQNIFAVNQGRTITLNGKITGRVRDITANNFSVDISGGTSLALNAHVTGLPDALNANYDVQLKDLHTTATEVKQYAGDKIPNAINIPRDLILSGNVKGSIKDATAQLSLKTSSGNVDIDASLKMQAGDTEYSAQVNTHALDLGYILKQDTLLGPVTMSTTLKGQNISPANIKAELETDIEAARFNKYNYTDIILKASTENGRDTANISIKDSALVMDLQANGSLVKDSEFIRASGHVEGANLQKLNILKQDVRASTSLAVNMKGNFADLNGSVHLNNIVILKDGDTYRVDSIAVTSSSDSIHSAFTVKSPVVKVDYDGNIKLTDAPIVLKHYFSRYFKLANDSVLASTDTSDQHFKLTVNILPHPIIGAILPGLENFNGADINSSFNKSNNTFKLDADISSLSYGSIRAAGVKANINSNNKSLNYSVSLESMETGPVKLAETSLSGSVADNLTQFDLRIHGEDTVEKLAVSGNLQQDSDKAYVLRLDNKGFILNNEKWDLAQDNYVRFGSKGFVVHDFVLSNSEQLLSVNTQEDNLETIKIKVNKFRLGTLSQIIEQDTALVRGTLDGNIELRNLQHSPAFVSDVQLTGLVYQDHPVGNVNVQANNETENKYNAELTLSGFENNLSVKGYYSAATGTNQLNFKVDIQRLNMASVEPFTEGQLRRSSGYLTGGLTVSGAIKQPVITGDVRFKNAAFNLAYINNYLTLKDEDISVDSKGIYFRSFNILDSLHQKASIAGAIYTSNFKQMNFDVTISTDHFMVLNTTMKDNPLFFGKVLMNSNIKVTGNEQLPHVKASVKLLKGSNLCVVIPSSKISTDRGEGVVVLVDTGTINNLMNAKDTLTLASKFKGIDVDANLEVTKETTFKLIVDKTSGDSLVVQGDGQLSFNMDETGNQNLTGTYNITNGSYRASFEKVIKRSLQIQSGGSITWNGTPTDATINLTAVYPVQTSPDNLLSSELAAATPEEKNNYKNQLHFDVIMMMKGEIMKPEISFKLDMDSEDQNAYGGTVYAKLTSVNGDPSELNKQVFSLLVMNEFIPPLNGGTGGTNYGDVATSLARSSVNQILTNELNQLSGRFLKGFAVNVGINANDIYSGNTVTQNTQVSASVKKSFFKERLSVEVGTNVNVQNDNASINGTSAQNLTGDVIVEYKANKDGSLRFKTFRQNLYEDFIDGLIVETGAGIIYTRDYDKFKELFQRRKKENITE